MSLTLQGGNMMEEYVFMDIWNKIPILEEVPISNKMTIQGKLGLLCFTFLTRNKLTWTMADFFPRIIQTAIQILKRYKVKATRGS